MYRILVLCGIVLWLSIFVENKAGAQNKGKVVINELHYRAEQTTEEFVELHNNSASTVDLGAYTISDDRMNAVTITNESFALAPGSYIVLVRDANGFEQAFQSVPYIEPPSWPILRQTGDSSVLYRNGEVIDSVGYVPSWGGYERNTSLERIDPNGLSDHRSNFASSDGPPTPGEENSIFQPNIHPPELLFTAAINEYLHLHFDEPLDSRFVPSATFNLPTQGTPSSVRLRSNRTEIVLTFSNSVEDGEITIDGIRDTAGNTLTHSSFPIAFPPGRIKSGQPGDLVINEIMYQPKLDEFDGEPDQVEYIELFNSGDRLLNISRLHRTNRSTQHGEADTTHFGAGLLALAPGEYALLHARREGVNLREAFPESTSAMDTGIHIQRESVTLNLRASGDLIKLHRSDGAVIDSVYYDPAWHHQQIQDTRGIALERILPHGGANDPRNWTSSLHPDGGTPLLMNSTHMDVDAGDAPEPVAIFPQTFTPGGGGEHLQTAITYRLDSDDAMVRIRIFDTMGRLVRNLESARPAGRFEDVIVWDGRNDEGNIVRLGIYVVHLEAVLYDADTFEHYRKPVVVADPF